MSDDLDLEILRTRKMLKLMSKSMSGKVEGGGHKKDHDFKKVLGEVLSGRAWEVLEAAERQYPEAARRVEEGLAHLVSERKFKGYITGEQLLQLFRSLGLNVRLQTEIRILENGKMKSLGEKLLESDL